MSVGKPVIASNIGGSTEQIMDGESGILVEPSDPDVLAQAIVSLLRDEQKRKIIGRAASERVRNKFSSEKFFQKLNMLYSSLIKN